MNINKAIRKQEKSNRRFLFLLSFIFLILPLILFAAGKVNLFFIIYLIVIELLVMISIIISINSNYLKYSCDGYRLKLKLNFYNDDINMICNKVLLVHTEDKNKNIVIILLTNSRFRSNKLNAVNQSFLKTHPYIADRYYKIKRQIPEEEYFYFIINKGGYKKYKLLDMLYKNCTHAQYTEEAVECIKKYRKI